MEKPGTVAFSGPLRAALTVIAVGFACTPEGDVPPVGTVEGHVAAAVAAAQHDHVVLLNRICTQVTGVPPRPLAEDAGPAMEMPGVAGREEWYTPPARAFDNLIYVGQTRYSSWAVTTTEGIVVIDPVFDYSVEAEVADGLASMGLDPETIRYVIVSHAHRDHVGGARYLQERFGARVVLAPADWDLLERSGGEWPKPERDIEAEDGYELRLGDATFRILHTPGHTPGTISTLFTVRDRGDEHRALLVGGTAFNFMGDPDEASRFQAYVDSAERLRDVVTETEVDVLLSNHPQYDGSPTKMPALAARGAADAHPYVIGTDAVARYLTVAAECGRAGLLGVG